MKAQTVVSAVANARVAIVGGSISGCAAAIALQNHLHTPPTVFERSSGDLKDRGLGIGLPIPTQKALLEAGMVTPNFKWIDAKTRQWIVEDDDTEKGRVAAEFPFPVQLHNWGLLWKELRSQVDEASYKTGCSIKSIEFRDNGVELFGTTEASTEISSLGVFDTVIAADGAQSILRHYLVPESNPLYSGYVLWRGSLPLKRLEEEDKYDYRKYFVDQGVLSTVGFQNGHGIFYCMPDMSGSDFIVNWGIYTHTPPGLAFDTPKVLRNLPDDAVNFFEEEALDNLPPFYQDIYLATKKVGNLSIHPIFDESPEKFADPMGHLFVLGDAGAILRPHTASGTTKAINDALCLRDLVESKASWKEIAEEYQKQRKADADTLVAVGRRLGEAQVLNTPDWSNMSQEDYVGWLQAQTSGSKIYLYQNMKKKANDLAAA